MFLDEEVVVLVKLALPLLWRTCFAVELQFSGALSCNQLGLLLLIEQHRNRGTLLLFTARRQLVGSGLYLLIAEPFVARSVAPKRVELHLLSFWHVLFSRGEDSADHSFTENDRVL